MYLNSLETDLIALSSHIDHCSIINILQSYRFWRLDVFWRRAFYFYSPTILWYGFYIRIICREQTNKKNICTSIMGKKSNSNASNYTETSLKNNSAVNSASMSKWVRIRGVHVDNHASYVVYVHLCVDSVNFI